MLARCVTILNPRFHFQLCSSYFSSHLSRVLKKFWLTVSLAKTEVVSFTVGPSIRRPQLPVELGDFTLPRSHMFKYLGVVITASGSLGLHQKAVSVNSSRRVLRHERYLDCFVASGFEISLASALTFSHSLTGNFMLSNYFRCRLPSISSVREKLFCVKLSAYQHARRKPWFMPFFLLSLRYFCWRNGDKRFYVVRKSMTSTKSRKRFCLTRRFFTQTNPHGPRRLLSF